MRAYNAAAYYGGKEGSTETTDARPPGDTAQRDTGGCSAAAPTPVMPHAGDISQIVAFDNDGWLGDHIHLFGDTPDLGKWGNSISSMVMLAGRWEFFDEEKLQGPKMELGPGAICTSKTTA